MGDVDNPGRHTSSMTGHYKMYMGGMGLIIGGLVLGVLGEISKKLEKH